MSDINYILILIKYIYIATLVFDFIVLVIVLYYKNVRTFHRYFLLTLASIILWKLTLLGALFITKSSDLNVISNYLAFSLGPISALLVALFLERFHGKKLLSIVPKTLLVLDVITGAVLSYIFINQRIIIGSAANQYYIPSSIELNLYYLTYIPIIVAIIYVSYAIYTDATGPKRKQGQYLLLGILLAFFFVCFSGILLPFILKTFFTSNFTLNQINNLTSITEIASGISVTIWTSITAYAITRHRLFDVHFIVRRWLVESIIVSTVIGLVLTFLYLITLQLDGQLKTFVWLALPLAVCGYFILARFLQTYRYRADLDVSLSPDIINHDIAEQDMQKLLKSLHAKFLELYNVESSVAVYDWRNKYFQDTSTKSTAPLLLTHPLVAYLQVQNDPIFLSELNELNSPITNLEHTRAIIQFFKERKAQAAVPLRDSFGLLGIVFISAQSDISKLYSRNTIADIQQISKVYGSAIQNVLTFQALTTKPE